jgi:hypothetical protein
LEHETLYAGNASGCFLFSLVLVGVSVVGRGLHGPRNIAASRFIGGLRFIELQPLRFHEQQDILKMRLF